MSLGMSAPRPVRVGPHRCRNASKAAACSPRFNSLPYNFIKIHRTLRVTPAMAAGVTPKLWEVADLAAAWNAWEGGKTGSVKSSMARRFSQPTVTGGTSFAQYDYKWSRIGLRISTKRVAIGALKALYGVKAANAAIRKAEEISGKKR